jgi:hypothetical protein
METFTPPRPFITHPDYRRDRERTLRNLSQEILKNAIDPPLLPLVQECISIPHCFPLQCCYGHFVHRLAPDRENLVPISSVRESVGPICYRIAYLAFCIENSRNGHSLYRDLAGMTEMDPAFIQFGSASWFWNMIPNTYIVQLEPMRGACLDTVQVTRDEAIHLERARGRFFGRLEEIAQKNMTICLQKEG